MKKGVLFTIGITMLVTIVFSLAILLFHNTQSTERRFSELALLDRLSDFDGMIQNNIRDINDYASGLSVKVSGDRVIFTEVFPGYTGFQDLITEYQSYIEENYESSPKITFDETTMTDIKTKQRMLIMSNIVYEHDDGVPGEVESYTINPGTEVGKVLGYNLELEVYATSCNFETPLPEEGDGMLVNINIIPQGGAICPWNEKIDTSGTNTWDISLPNSDPLGDPWHIIITIEPSSKVLDVNAVRTKKSTLEIKLMPPTDEPIEVKYPGDLFTINFEDAKLLKKGTVTLAS